MKRVRLFKRKPTFWRTLYKTVTICVLASLLAGLIPPLARTAGSFASL